MQQASYRMPTRTVPKLLHMALGPSAIFPILPLCDNYYLFNTQSLLHIKNPKKSGDIMHNRACKNQP